jgi:hypothetical protein
MSHPITSFLPLVVIVLLLLCRLLLLLLLLHRNLAPYTLHPIPYPTTYPPTPQILNPWH